MAKDTQISAQISETTRELMEKHVRQTGVKKGHLVEQALLHHLQAIEDLPERVRKKLPRYPVPVLGLARLAVDESVQSRGLGGQLLRFVLNLAAKMADEVGCAGVVVDAKAGAVDFYAKYGFTAFETI